MAKQQTTRWWAKVQKLYEDQGRELWAMLYSQCSDAEIAHDALQESFTRLHEQNGAPIRDVRAWVLRVGSNWMRDVARRKKTAAKNVDFLDSLPGSPQDPVALLQRQELFAGVRKALTELRGDDREVLVLRYALGWSSNQIATALKTSSPAIDMRLLRARRRLAKILSEAGIDNDDL